MIIIAMAAALLLQEEPVASPEELTETLNTIMSEVTDAAEDMDAEPGPASTVRTLVRITESVFANSPFEVFSLQDREVVIEQMIPAMVALTDFEGEQEGEYSLDFSANAFRNRDDRDDEHPFCMAGAPDTFIDEPLTDPAGNALNIRICWFGRQGDEEGELVGSYIYQINNGIYYVQFRGGVAGMNADGIQERLDNIERLIEPLVRHTVIARGEQEPQPALDAE